jgi:cytochrome c553
MKKILFATLIASVSLMAAENVTPVANTGDLEAGAALYMKKCSICHGAEAKKTPIKGMSPIAGMKTTKLIKVLKHYQDDDRIGHGYSEEMVNSTVFLSQKAIDSIALYVNSLK